MGTVENVGLKTTRLRSLSGEQLVFSNSDLLGSRIRNYKRMSERRAVFTLGVTYDTPLEKLKRIPAMIREVVESQSNTPSTVHTSRPMGRSLWMWRPSTSCWCPTTTSYMDTQQTINLALFEHFAAEGIDFAFPTQTLHVKREGGGVANGAA